MPGVQKAEDDPCGQETVKQMPGEHQHGALPLCLSNPTNTWPSDVLGGTTTFLMVLFNLELWVTSLFLSFLVCIWCEYFHTPDSHTDLQSGEHLLFP